MNIGENCQHVNFHSFSDLDMFGLNLRSLQPLRANLRFFSNLHKSPTSHMPGSKLILENCETEKMCKEVSSVNSRLENLHLTAKFLSGQPLLKLPTANPKSVICPTTQTIQVKRFIVEETKKVEEPEVFKKRVYEPSDQPLVKKHAIRMIVLRRRKMKKHQLKKLWQRMYLKFRTNREAREKKKEYEFRGRLAGKVSDARKFSAEKYVEDYLNDYHTPLMPKTYEGKRLPEWLIKELIEQDKEHEKEKALIGKDYAKQEMIVKENESVKEFIARTWNKT